jgi:NAD(P)H-flavin reductase
MNQILEKVLFSEKVAKFVVKAPRIAKSRKPGHFVILRVDEKGERIPLTIADADPVAGTIVLVVQKMGVSSAKLFELEAGDSILDLVGPLGKATHIHQPGTVLACGGGVGVAPMLPIVEGFKKAGNRVISILAARNKDLIILEDEIRKWSDEVIVMTDDGSYGTKGLVTAGAEMVIQREKVDECVAIGPAVMMKCTAVVRQNDELRTQGRLSARLVVGGGLGGAGGVRGGGRGMCG